MLKQWQCLYTNGTQETISGFTARDAVRKRFPDDLEYTQTLWKILFIVEKNNSLIYTSKILDGEVSWYENDFKIHPCGFNFSW